jgi:uncharacterized protein YgiM (DUF1202 family)
MRKPLLALSLALSAGLGVTQVADTVAAAPSGTTPPQATSPVTPSVSTRSTTHAVSGAAIVRTAMKYLGYPYTAVGNSPSTGFSCIGFVSYVYRQNGIPLPGDLSDALAYAPQVSFSNLQPGDIMFFKNTVWSGLSHAAIYIGGGKFIHAEWYGKGVRITSFYNDSVDGNYWPVHYMTANRPWTGVAGGTVTTGGSAGTTPVTPPSTTQSSIPSGPAAIVTAKSGLNLRSAPSKTAAVITVLPRGTTVYVVGHSGGWDKVEETNGTVGWALAAFISGGSVSRAPTAPARVGQPTATHRVVTSTVSGLRVHASPSAAGQVVGSVGVGQKLTVLGSRNGWYKVRLPNGTVGWVSAAYIRGSGGTSAKAPTTTYTYGKTARVTFNVRSGPSTSYPILTVIPVGGSYHIMSWSHGWAHVRLPSGVVGWIDGQVTASTSSPTYSSYSSGRAARITAGIRVHSRPGVNAPVVGLLGKGAKVRVIGYHSGWDHVRMRNGRTGWVSSAYVR